VYDDEEDFDPRHIVQPKHLIKKDTDESTQPRLRTTGYMDGRKSNGNNSKNNNENEMLYLKTVRDERVTPKPRVTPKNS